MERLGPGGWRRLQESEVEDSLKGDGALGAVGAKKF
jgi:hypothetical protein